MTTSKPRSLDWLLDDLVERLPDVRYAVVLSTDGLLLGHGSAMDRADAERFCAMASTLHGVARSAGNHFEAGGVCQTVVELDRAVLFITAAGDNACLALLTAETANMGMVAYEMNQTVQRVGAHLSVDPRPHSLDGSGFPRP
ncbi:roadblock/LC7 domain-containing protein [Nocardia puris]|uniref:roadblock/LC7 domain-containing protein n=1 Tax=Nocardia puris TaxID=208602 RepID=UPI001895AE29|nr:roadblock/LC7 domain-containing protein [Nocardia puris]MBF6212377.1 roadblock/LC7 domain-containing protein [Nocardia puris]MBF6366624.1 roadblock/LC7 domain-containing protein [Nocardia puris]MBF6460966.1 roadblock/LC7 domain-containing protein [Nocardia puris]